ncbi:hypothetical protein CHS0354_019416 [Potamilus streckersoni]|uniref:Uncharacterized protein n=1 Tax=Potamilus streckersoni TaxID=2493646 RepID=A0AAE0SHI2_9BIVA|nr:hypothetical protein CHS0354_019416 [Potamilus streckersoni]
MPEYTNNKKAFVCEGCLKWAWKRHPGKNPDEFLIFVALIFIVLGISIMGFGYIVPRDYTVDPLAPAREMEAMEIYYAKLSYILDLCIVIGMGCIAVGGLIVSGMMTYGIIKGFPLVYDDEEKILQETSDLHSRMELRHSSSQMNSYGST